MESLKRRLRALARAYILQAEEDELISRMRRYGWIYGFKPRLTWCSSSRTFLVKDDKNDNRQLHVARKTRLKWYLGGVEARLVSLERQYLLEDLQFSDGDTIIDVGANIGELSFALRSRANIKVIAIEPEPFEASALRLNLSGIESEIYESPLWSHSEEIDWFSANETGDSSAFPHHCDAPSRKKQAFTLDEIFNQSRFFEGGVKLLKLEAEGAEPEILKGSRQTLKAVQWLTVDVGPERGVESDNTLIAVLELLVESGFKPVRFGMPRPVLLLKRGAS